MEEELNKLLPEANIIRMDVDTTRRKGAHERLYKVWNQQLTFYWGQMIIKV